MPTLPTDSELVAVQDTPNGIMAPPMFNGAAQWPAQLATLRSVYADRCTVEFHDGRRDDVCRDAITIAPAE